MKISKSNSEELNRLKNVLETDRTNINNNFNSLLKIDLEKLLNNYFDKITGLKINVTGAEKGCAAEITFNARTIKGVGGLPEA